MIEQSSVFVISRAARAAAPEPVGAWVAQADSANPKTTHINQRLPSNPHGLILESMKFYLGEPKKMAMLIKSVRVLEYLYHGFLENLDGSLRRTR